MEKVKVPKNDALAKRTSAAERGAAPGAALLRRTFATSYLMGGGNLEFLRVLPGHYDYTVTKNLLPWLPSTGCRVYRFISWIPSFPDYSLDTFSHVSGGLTVP